VRFADDIVVGFEVKSDAVRFWAELGERMRQFSLELHPEKTRLLEFEGIIGLDVTAAKSLIEFTKQGMKSRSGPKMEAMNKEIGEIRSKTKG